MDSSSRPAMLLVTGRSVGLAASFAIGIVLARMFDPAVFGVYKQFFLIYATLYGVLQLGMAESLYYFVPRKPEHTGRYAANAIAALGLTGTASIGVLFFAVGRFSGVPFWNCCRIPAARCCRIARSRAGSAFRRMTLPIGAAGWRLSGAS